ncbi:MAG TPA: 5-bromo-4-chloroindolyl phosphate hydrolysis family protein [Rhizomicrobium sp.]|nr:5-bromo-4-chloroindolyl phosphate hydrolysis family protein [Rhizomicrobium sp.]
MERGTSTLLAGALGAIALPVCVFLLHLPLWLGLIVGGGVFAGLRLALRPSGFGLKLDDMSEAQQETVRGLIGDGNDALDRLKRTIPNIKDARMKAMVQGLGGTADKVFARLKGNPDRAMSVRRMLTFYLPNAASIAEGWETLERNADPSPQRMAQTRDVMSALNDAFGKFATEADAPELQDLDLSLKLVKDSLKADLEKTA